MHYVYYVQDCSPRLQEFVSYYEADIFCMHFVHTEDSWLEFMFETHTGIEPLSSSFDNIFVREKVSKKTKKTPPKPKKKPTKKKGTK